jgi:hypothetical protein
MTLADLLMLSPKKVDWNLVGQSLVAVDSLVHEFLHRTGALKAFDCEHHYGPACGEKCSQLIYSISDEIDASIYNKKYPEYFPRFIEHSIWSFCAEDRSNICNGKKIGRGGPCEMGKECPVNDLCKKVPLKE